MIRTENLVKAYNGVKAVDSVNMAVGKGEICGFLGPNGAGKTTTIGMLVGLIEPTSGKCFINDIEVSGVPLKIKRMIGYLPEGAGFYSNLSARQNLKYLSRFYDIKDADARIGELLSYVGLEKVNKPAGAFSRGMKQRLGLARALLNDPDGDLFRRADKRARSRRRHWLQEDHKRTGAKGKDHILLRPSRTSSTRSIRLQYDLHYFEREDTGAGDAGRGKAETA